MKHISDIQILDLLGGHVQADEQKSLLAHIAQCTDCQQRWNELRQTWDELGEWEIDASDIDLRPSLQTAIQNPSRRFKFPLLQGWTRIAASIILAVAAGHAIGKISAQKSAEQWALATAQASFFDVLSPGSPTGWGEPALPGNSLEND